MESWPCGWGLEVNVQLPTVHPRHRKADHVELLRRQLNGALRGFCEVAIQSGADVSRVELQDAPVKVMIPEF